MSDEKGGRGRDLQKIFFNHSALHVAGGIKNERLVECSWIIDLSSFSNIPSEESVKNPGSYFGTSERVPMNVRIE